MSDRLSLVERIEKAEAYLEGLANTIDDTLDDDSVDWSHELRSVAVELRNVALSLGMQQAAVSALTNTHTILADVAAERERQSQKWGVVSRPPLEWFAILGEEFGEVAEKVTEGYVPPESDFDKQGYRTELIQVAAVAVSAVENLDYGAAGK